MALYEFPAWMGKTPRKCVEWSKDEELRLKRRWHEGASLHEICKEHGRDTGGIESRLRKVVGDNFYNREIRERKPKWIKISMISGEYKVSLSSHRYNDVPSARELYSAIEFCRSQNTKLKQAKGGLK